MKLSDFAAQGFAGQVRRALETVPGGAARYLALSLLAAAAVHIVAIFSAPSLAENDAFAAIARAGPELAVIEIGRGAPSGVVDPYDDPVTLLAACHFDLAGGPVRLQARVPEGFLSISLNRRGGGVFYAVTDRAASRGVLSIVVGTPAQLDDLRAQDPEDQPVLEIRAAASADEGFAAFRTLALWPSRREEARAATLGATCTRL